MKFGKRIFLFFAVNILIVATLSIVTSLFGIQPYLNEKGINYESLIVFALIWGFGGAFISLALSKVMAKWMMGVQIIPTNTTNMTHLKLIDKVHRFSRNAGIQKMPEVGIYESPDLNAFATGPSKNNSLVAVSTGLLENMNEAELDGVLAHEVAHVANGDMVTMTLVQGVVNAFVIFVSRIIAHFASQFVDEEKQNAVRFGVTLVSEILLGILGMLVVSAFSRKREFRADAGGASLAGKNQMIAALQKLQTHYHTDSAQDDQPAIASLKISGKSNGFLRLFSTHPDLEDRILKLKQS